MSTPVSAAASYCQPADFLARYDSRTVGDKVLDFGQRADPEAMTAVISGLPENTNLLAALNAASGEVEAACFTANRYAPSDLQTLTGMSLEMLKTMVADIAYQRLLWRRKPEAPATEAYKSAMSRLNALRLGETIFGLQEAADAGNPEASFEQETDIQTRDLATLQAGRMFGRRGNEARALRFG